MIFIFRRKCSNTIPTTSDNPSTSVCRFHPDTQPAHFQVWLLQFSSHACIIVVSIAYVCVSVCLICTCICLYYPSTPLMSLRHLTPARYLPLITPSLFIFFPSQHFCFCNKVVTLCNHAFSPLLVFCILQTSEVAKCSSSVHFTQYDNLQFHSSSEFRDFILPYRGFAAFHCEDTTLSLSSH